MGDNSGMATGAGILLIIAGIIAMIFWIIIGFIFGTIGFIMSMIPDFGAVGAYFMICGVIGIILSIITILGGVFALQRKNWCFAFVASIIGLFIIGFYLSSILSLIALILIAISKQEFDGVQRVDIINRRCPSCGRSIPMDAQLCPYCGKDFRLYKF